MLRDYEILLQKAYGLHKNGSEMNFYEFFDDFIYQQNFNIDG